jgi:hypothetical protein
MHIRLFCFMLFFLESDYSKLANNDW